MKNWNPLRHPKRNTFFLNCLKILDSRLVVELFSKANILSMSLIIVECGIGKVNSAMVSTILIQEFKCEILIFSGIAGGN